MWWSWLGVPPWCPIPCCQGGKGWMGVVGSARGSFTLGTGMCCHHKATSPSLHVPGWNIQWGKAPNGAGMLTGGTMRLQSQALPSHPSSTGNVALVAPGTVKTAAPNRRNQREGGKDTSNTPTCCILMLRSSAPSGKINYP